MKHERRIIIYHEALYAYCTVCAWWAWDYSFSTLNTEWATHIGGDDGE